MHVFLFRLCLLVNYQGGWCHIWYSDNKIVKITLKSVFKRYISGKLILLPTSSYRASLMRWQLKGNAKRRSASINRPLSTTFRQTNSSEDAVLLRAGPREGEIAKTRVSWGVVACDKDWDSFAENGFQELGASLVRDRWAEVACQEPGQL